MPRFGAKLYNKLMKGTATSGYIKDIATETVSAIAFNSDIINSDKNGDKTSNNIENKNKPIVLDVGTGPGFLLKELQALNPNLKLVGLDISKNMLEIARRNLFLPDVTLVESSIEHTSFPDNYFNFIVSSGSFYLWAKPVNCLNEIFRILKPGSTTFIYDTHKDFNRKAYLTALNENLKHESFLFRRLGKFFLNMQLKQAYSLKTIEDIVRNSKFINTYQISEKTLSNLPIFVCIELYKPGS